MKKGEGVYNVVVIGAGTAGLVTAAGTAGLGGRVALVERNLMGGDCLNFGCVPSKALISSARLIQQIRESEKMGVRSTITAVCIREGFRANAFASREDRAERFRGTLRVIRRGCVSWRSTIRFAAPSRSEWSEASSQKL